MTGNIFEVILVPSQLERPLFFLLIATMVWSVIVFIPIYPNTLPTVPKPSKGSRTPSLVFSNLPASQRAITRLLNRCTR